MTGARKMEPLKAVALSTTTFYQSVAVRIGGGNTHRILDSEPKEEIQMTKYNVQWATVAHHAVEVEAENEDEAYELAVDSDKIETDSDLITDTLTVTKIDAETITS